MATALRFTATVACLCITTAPVFAQLPVAPEPHPTLDDLVKEYQRCGLPIPPKDAELVRFRGFLGFRDPTAKPGELSRCLVGTSWEVLPPQEFPWNPLSKHGQAVTPTPHALKDVSRWAADWFCFTAQCKMRGWDALADAAYAEGRRELADENAKRSQTSTPVAYLRSTAWDYWKSQLVVRGTDRKQVWERLNDIALSDPKALSLWDLELLEDLKLTLAPWKSKPGSVEAIIDELTEYWDEQGDSYNETGHGAYWKLIDLGFDAVPALLEHVEDRRLTRAEGGSPTSILKHNVRVGHLVELILGKISGGHYHIEKGTVASEWVPAKDHKWWKRAKTVGEEQWLLDIVLRPTTGQYGEPPNEIVLRVIRVKYPHRLADVYRKLINERPEMGSDLVTKEIVASKLSREQKLALLEEGVANKEFTHQFTALETLAGVDDTLFRKHLHQCLQSWLRDLERDPKRFTHGYWIEGLFRKTDDRKCWDALAAMTRRVTTDARLHFIGNVGGWLEPSDPDTSRLERIRYLLSFLDDAEVGELPNWERWIAVRDHATNQLARELGFLPPEWFRAPRSPREIALLRDIVREAVERELARPRK